MTNVLGIDIGGSGIKGAPVDLDKGDFATDRLRIPTPQPSTPEAVAEAVKQIVEHFSKDIKKSSPIGLTVPAQVIHGRVPWIANLDQSWAGLKAEKFFTDKVGRPITLVNDADAAGVAEDEYGAAAGVNGLVLVTTQGTGIGSALILNGVLIPNTELGHIEIDGFDAESRAASSIREKEGLTYPEWAERLQRYYETLEKLFSPDLFVVGGGVSKDWKEWMPLLKLNTPMVPAKLRNKAGIVGAAWLAHDRVDHPEAKLVLPKSKAGSKS